MTAPDDVVRVTLRYPDLETFVDKYAPNVTRGGIFLATREPRPVGTVVRFAVSLRQGPPLLSGEGRVSWLKAFNSAEPHRPYGMGVQFLHVDPQSRPVLERLLAAKAQSAAASGRPSPGTTPTDDRGAEPKPSVGSNRPTHDGDFRLLVERARALADRAEELEALLAREPERGPVAPTSGR